MLKLRGITISLTCVVALTASGKAVASLPEVIDWLKTEMQSIASDPASPFELVYEVSMPPAELRRRANELLSKAPPPPMHPLRAQAAQLMQLAKREEIGPTRKRCYFFDGELWRFNSDYGAAGSIRVVDVAMSADVSWRRTSEGLLLVDTSNPSVAPSQDVNTYASVMRGEISLALYGALGFCSGYQLDDSTVAVAPDGTWKAVLRAPQFPMISIEGAWDASLKRGFASRATAGSPTDKTRRSVESSSWMSDPATGMWWAARVRDDLTTPDTTVLREFHFMELTSTDRRTVEEVARPPSAEDGDAVRGQASITYVNDARSGGEGVRRLTGGRWVADAAQPSSSISRSSWYLAGAAVFIIAALALWRARAKGA